MGVSSPAGLNTEDLIMSFGENLKQLRQAKGLTQRELEKLAKIKFGHISKLERNESNPKLDTIYKLLESLECSADTLLDTHQGTLLGDVKLQVEKIMGLPKERRKSIIDVIDHYTDGVGHRETLYDDKDRLIVHTPKLPNAADNLHED